MMSRKSCIFLLVATLQIISCFIAAAQPFSPLDHRALPLQKQAVICYFLWKFTSLLSLVISYYYKVTLVNFFDQAQARAYSLLKLPSTQDHKNQS
ncbi:hypothetical protein DCAR_0830725 [Daucus carota subsp. sativus]|uniref:Uncharacterized protein n=1 Tax=Daucus carota subsp. sativus TaxID=79200 RepID=A0A175YL41_DAUCS|nr:hypothetical protein DCAR_0830725 [Daucus carota subsp. sativus]